MTDCKITDENVAALVATGRARWKIENENNNTLKTKGYHLEHNFGHGKEHLSSLLAAMNMLALLSHTFLSLPTSLPAHPRHPAHPQDLLRRPPRPDPLYALSPPGTP